MRANNHHAVRQSGAVERHRRSRAIQAPRCITQIQRIGHKLLRVGDERSQYVHQEDVAKPMVSFQPTLPFWSNRCPDSTRRVASHMLRCKWKPTEPWAGRTVKRISYGFLLKMTWWQKNSGRKHQTVLADNFWSASCHHRRFC